MKLNQLHDALITQQGVFEAAAVAQLELGYLQAAEPKSSENTFIVSHNIVHWASWLLLKRLWKAVRNDCILCTSTLCV